MYGTILVDGHYKVGCEFHKADDITYEFRVISDSSWDKIYNKEVELLFRDKVVFKGKVQLSKIIRNKNWHSHESKFGIIKNEE